MKLARNKRILAGFAALAILAGVLCANLVIVRADAETAPARTPKDIVLVDLNAEKNFTADKMTSMGGTQSVEKVEADESVGFPGGTAYVDKLPGKAVAGIAKNAANYPADFGYLDSSYVFESWVYIDDISKVDVLRFDLSQDNKWDAQGYTFQVGKSNDIDLLTAGTQTLHTGWNHFVVPLYKIGVKGTLPTQINSFRFFHATGKGGDATLKLASLVLRDRAAEGYTNGFTAADEKNLSDMNTKLGNQISVKNIASLTDGDAVEGQPTSGTAYAVDYKAAKPVGKASPGIGFENLNITVDAATTMTVDAWIYVPQNNNVSFLVFRAFKNDKLQKNNASVTSLIEGMVGAAEVKDTYNTTSGWQHFVKTVKVPAGKIGSVSFHNHKKTDMAISFAVGSLKLTVDGTTYDVVTPESDKAVSKVRNFNEEYSVVDTASLTGGVSGVPSGTAYYADNYANAFWGLPLENQLDIDISNMAIKGDTSGKMYYKLDTWIWVKDAAVAKAGNFVLRLFPNNFNYNTGAKSYIEHWKFNYGVGNETDLDDDTEGAQVLQNGWNHVVKYVDNLGAVNTTKVAKISSALLYVHNNNGSGEGGASNRTSYAMASLQILPVTEVNDVIAMINALPATVTYADKAAVEAARAAVNALDATNQKRVTDSVGTRLTAAEEAIAACKAKITDVETKIDAIGDVTLESAAAIEAAETAYAALTEAEKADVSNAAKLTAARAAYDKLVADSATAGNVIAAIDEIGEVTLDSESKIAAAEALYAALSDDQKALVTNYDKLTAARAKYDALKADKDAEDAFNAKVDAIGEVTLDSKAAIEDAEAAYAALTDTQKAAVADAKAKLDAARAKYDAMAALDAKAKPVREAIDAIGKVTLESKDKIEAAEAAYNALTEEEKAYVTNYSTLKTARDTYNDLLESDKYPMSSPNFGFDVINSRYVYEVKRGADFVNEIKPELGAGHDGSANGATYLRGMKAGDAARILTAGGTVKFAAQMDSVVKFWVYVSNISVINTVRFELSDTQDANEKEWEITKQITQNGWNEITVDFSGGTGKLDLNDIRFWRCFILTKSGEGTYDFGLDELSVTNTSKPAEKEPTDFDKIADQYNKVTSGFNYTADALMDGWKYDGGPKVDTDEKKEGTGSLRFDTHNSNVLGIIQSQNLNVDMTNAWDDGYVGFWLYVNDRDAIKQIMMEISSNNEIDKNEYQIELTKQVTDNGWNYVVFKLSDMRDQQLGEVDKANILRWRLFVLGNKTGKDITLRLDDISLLTKKIGGDEVSGFGYDAEAIDTGKYDYSGTGAKIDTDAKQGSGSVRFDTKDEKSGNVLGLIRTKSSNRLNFKVENPNATAVQFWVYVSNASAVKNAVFELASKSQDMDETQWEFRGSLSDGWNQVTLMLKNGSRPSTNPDGTENAFTTDSINFWRVYLLGSGTGETVTVKIDDVKMIVIDDENNKDPDKQFNDDCDEINDTKYQYIPTPTIGEGNGGGKAYEFTLANTSDADSRMRWVNRAGQLNFAIDDWKNSYVTFDIYLSDPSLVKQLAFELSSIAVDASDELQYNVETGTLTEGWNTVLVPLLAMDPGSLDLEHLRASRIFLLADKSGEELTVRLDNIRLHNRNEQDESDESSDDSDNSGVTPDTSDRDNPNTGAASAVLPAVLLLGTAAVAVVTLRRRRGN